MQHPNIPKPQGIIQPNDRTSSFSPGVSALMVACVRGNTMAAKQLIRPKRNTTDGLGMGVSKNSGTTNWMVYSGKPY